MSPVGVDEWVARSGERREAATGWRGAVERVGARVGWWPRLAIVGVLGALIGGFLGSTFFGWDVTGFNVGSIVLAFLGAVVLLLILRAIPGRQPFER